MMSPSLSMPLQCQHLHGYIKTGHFQFMQPNRLDLRNESLVVPMNVLCLFSTNIICAVNDSLVDRYFFSWLVSKCSKEGNIVANLILNCFLKHKKNNGLFPFPYTDYT